MKCVRSTSLMISGDEEDDNHDKDDDNLGNQDKEVDDNMMIMMT